MSLMALSNAFGAVTWWLQEDFESGQIPATWTQEVVSSNVANWVIEPTSAATYPATGNESNYYVALRNNTGMDQHYVTKLITPAINFTAGTAYQPQLVFKHAQVGFSTDFDTLKVYYRSNANAAWTLLQVFSSRIDVWQTDTIALTGFGTAAAYQIAFEAVENLGRGIVLDDVRVMNASACQATSDMEATGVGASKVILSWNGDLMTDTFEVVLTTEPVTDWDDYTPAYHGYATDFTYEVTGLRHTTTYYAYVRAKCDDNETGWTAWSSTSFRTRAQIDLPYMEAFSNAAPEGWTTSTNLTSTKPSFASSNVYSVDSTFLMQFGSITAGKYALAVTPEINAQSLQGAQVSFWGFGSTYMATPLNSYIARLYVGVMTDPSDTSTLVIVDSVELKVANKHQHFDVSLENYTGNGQYVAFLAKNASRATYFYLDNLTISQPAVLTPTDVKVVNATPDGFDVQVNLHGANAWNLRVANAADYKHMNELPSSFLFSLDGITGNTYHVNASLGDSIIVVYAQAVTGANASTWSFPVTVRIPARATLPLAYEFSATSEATLLIKSLENEIHVNSTVKAFPGLYFQLLDFSNFYPKIVTSTPTYAGGHLQLQGIDRWVTLPYVDSFAGQMISFQLAAGTAGQSRVAVGIMSDPYDLSTFTQLDVFEGPADAYEKCEVDLDGHDALGHYVALVAVAPKNSSAVYGSVNHIDALHIEAIPSCREASHPAATVGTTYATVTWNAMGMQKWFVELFATSALDSLIDAQEVQTTSVSFRDLQSVTTYYYRINTICGTDTVWGGKNSFTTSYGMPFVQDFNSLTTGIPAGWDNTEGTAGTSYRWTYYATGHTGKCLRFNSYSAGKGSTSILATPAIYLDAPAMLSFYWKNPTGGDAQVLISTDGGTTRTQISPDSMLFDVPTWTEMELDLSAYANQTVIVYFNSISNYGNGDAYHYLDDVQIIEAPSCYKPKKVTIADVTSSTATASWTAGKNETQWQYVVSLATQEPDWSAATVVNTTTVSLTGLNASTAYVFNVRSYCSAADQSEISTGIFQTKCGVAAIPFLETFNNLESNEIPNCWDNSQGTTTSASYKWSYTVKSGNGNCQGTGPDGSNCIQFDSYLNSNGNTNTLQTPAINLTDAAKLTFDWKNPTGGPARVLLSTATDSTKVVLKSTGLEGVSDWTEMTVDLGAYLGQTVTIYFEGTSNYGNGDAYLYLDNVKVATYDVNCAGVMDLRAAAASASDANIYWTAGGEQSVVIEVSDSANFVDVIQYTGVTANPFVLTQLTENHTYYVRVRQSCDLAGDWKQASFKTLCVAISPEELGLQTFEDANALDCWTVGVSAPGVRESDAPGIATGTGFGHVLYFNKSASVNDSVNYGDGLYAIMPQLDIDSINKYEITFNAFKASSEAKNVGRITVGIITDPSDFSTFTAMRTLNLDLATDSTDEKLYTISFQSYTGDYNDEYGKYVMFLAQAGDSANSVAVDNVEMSFASSCPAIVECEITNIEPTSAICRWEANGAQAYVVAIMPTIGNPDQSDAIPVIMDTVAVDTMALTGLNPATEYYAYVRALCADADARWSTHTRFMSACGTSVLPFAQNFNTLTSGIPVCWDNSKGTISTASYKWSYYAAGHTGACLRQNHYNASKGSDNYIATPDIYLDKPATLEFYWKNPAGGPAQVLIAAVGDSVLTLLMDSTDLMGIDDWTEKSIDLSAYTGKTVNIYFYGKSNYGNGDAYLYLDDVNVYAIPSCKPLSSLDVVSTDRRAITIQMTPKTGETLGRCEIVCSESQLGIAALDSVAKIIVDSTAQYTITGLNRETFYHIYARVNCGEEDGASDWLHTTATTKGLLGCDDYHQIGSGTGGISSLPTNTYYNYSVTEQIYTPEEIGQAGKINSVSFYNAGDVRTRDIDIYILSTTKSSFTSTSDWVSVTSASKVYSGVATFKSAQWTTFEFSNVFDYNGTDNVLLVVDDNTGSYESAVYFLAYEGDENSTLLKYQDGSNMDPAAMTVTGTLSAAKNQILFGFCYQLDPCPQVGDINVELLGVGTTEAMIRWEASDADYLSGYDVIVSDSVIANPDSVAPTFANIQADSVLINTLSPETTYYVYVRAICMAEGVNEGLSVWKDTTFATLANCPAVVDLASELSDATSVKVSWLTALSDLELAFAYVYSTDSLSAADLAQAEKIYVNDTLAFELTNLAYDQTYYIYVASVCGNNLSPWSKTVIKTDAACAPVRNLTAERIEHNRVVLTWNPSRFGSETQWEAGIVGDSASIVYVSDTAKLVSAMIIGLEHDSTYTAYVRAICAEGETSEMSTLVFTTGPNLPDCYVVGSGTTSSTYLPTYSYYNYAHTQQIYTPDEIGQEGVITAIAFYNTGAEKTRSINLYLQQTAKSSFESTSDWAELSAGDLVFSGTVTFSENVWTELPLTTPFVYNGTDNLLVAVNDLTGSYSSGLSCLSFTGTVANQAMYVYRDASAYSIGALPTATSRTATKNQIRICVPSEEDCHSVSAMAVKDITTNTAVASWEPMGSERAWRVFLADTVVADATGFLIDTAYNYVYALGDLTPDKDYWFYVQPLCGAEWKSVKFRTAAECSTPVDIRVDSLTDTSAKIVWNDALASGTSYVLVYGLANRFSLTDTATYQTIVTDNEYVVLNGLTAVTSYSFALKALCAPDGESRWSDINTFKTPCNVTPTPWTEGFESYAGTTASATDGVVPDCWDAYSIGANVVPHVIETGSYAYIHSGTKALTFYGSGYNYAVLPVFDRPLNDLQITFWYRSESTYGEMTLGYFEAGDTTLHPIKVFNYNTTMSQYEVVLDTLPATAYRLAFCWYKPGTWYTACIDDILVERIPTCMKPNAVSVQSVDIDSATVAWTTASNQTQWQYVCVPFGTAPDWSLAVLTDTTVATVSGLESNTSYDFYVRAYCSADDQSTPISTTFATACGIISNLPWSEGFEAYQAGSYSSSSEDYIPACWDMSTYGTVKPHVTYEGTYSYVHSGANSLTFYGADSCMAILPEFDANLNTLQIAFYYEAYSSVSCGDLTLGYITWSDSTFHPIESFEPTTTFTKAKVMLNSVPAGADRLAFFYEGGSYSYCNISIDDITVSELNLNCAGIAGLQVTGASLSGAQVEWTYIAGVNNAQIQVAADQNFNTIIDSALVQNALSYLVVGLQPSSTYYVRVRQACGDGEFSEWTDPVEFTTSYGVPFTPQFNSGIPSDWMRSNTEANAIFSGQPMVSYSGGWMMVDADTIINSNHFRGNIYGTSWHYWAVTPSIDLTPNVGDGLILSIDAGLVPYSTTSAPDIYTGTDDRFLVAVSLDGGATWNAANATVWDNTGSGDFVYNEVPTVGQTYRINMSDYAGHVVKIGFYGESTISNADNYFHFGNIRLETVATTTYLDSICEGYSFNKNGFSVSYDQLHVGLNAVSRYAVNGDGSISLTIQKIWVNAASVFEIPVTLCEGEHYNGYGFDVTVTKSENIRKRVEGGNQFGCDSTAILQITMLPTIREELHVGCNAESYTWHGKTYYQSTIVSDTTSSVVTGCDSITTLYLTMCDNVTYNYHGAFCGGSYSDEFFENLTTPGQYSTTAVSEIGCETYANLTLHQLQPGQDYIDTVYVEDLPYVLNNDTLCTENDFEGVVYHGSKDFGCGVVNVTVVVARKNALDNVTAGKLQVAPNPVAVGEDISILTDITAGADYSCRVFDAVGKLVYETFEPAKTIPGLPVAGMYTVRIASGSAIYQGKLIVR